MNKPVLVVTGCAGGIGSAIVRLFQRKGWYVVGIDKVSEDDACDLFLRTRLESWDSIASAMAQINEAKLKPTALVHAAAYMPCAALKSLSMNDWQLCQQINVQSFFQLLQGLLETLAAQNGCAIALSSVHAHATSENVAAYASSKAALLGFVKAAAVELGKEGVRINAVTPGAVDTPMLQIGLERSNDAALARKQLAKRTPLLRIGRADEIAAGVYFAVEAGFMTGTELVLDGGALIRLSTEGQL